MTEQAEYPASRPFGVLPVVAAQQMLHSYAEQRAANPALKDDMIALKLMKLVYLAHGFYLALANAPLVDDEVQAWKNGPVFPELYENIKFFAKDGREQWPMPPDALAAMVAALPPAERKPDDFACEVIDRVCASFGRYDGRTLSASTHKEGSPWSRVYKRGKQNPIDNTDIRDSFGKLLENASKGQYGD